ncbi:glycine dehydrogenase (decarboxylating) alpha subunit /glycine dehydrogenase (decarboxylating) beta subunit [Granulicella rosea]|uniref:Glycine dehydrogenase (decarboxylating) n=1 Tax=Granulicella rosea TaxID=474952 RepID=A0A239K9Z6_9BACT|nr:aminomethyl-transferring glycine dehydrogenase [Granulicella rosea]SNT14588.1 glycine dehydrogenase (decarboxylating) alpha subunit /glycine dehydrogenase (decarboxylating) beta subunit [Granulicella rosea]
MAQDTTQALKALDSFAKRHIGPTRTGIEEMLQAIGVESLDELIAQAVPSSILHPEPLDIGPALTEPETLAYLRTVAAKNKVMTSLIGQGYYGTLVPGVIQRNILENPAWYTAYTPYQPEISQGRLEALINFQTMVCDLTGLDIANASLLDEATAAAEAMAMAQRGSKSKKTAFFVDKNCHPQTIAVMQTRSKPFGWTLVIGDPELDLEPTEVFGAILQYPGTGGQIVDYRKVIAALHAAGAVAVMAADPLALTLLTSPGELGADMAIGSTQRFGVPMGYGGPHAAFLATRDDFKRSLPGRLVGVSIDARGNQAYRLALQTREQHIRREKATSNICTAQVLLAVMAGMYAVYHGPEGLKGIAAQVHGVTAKLAAGLASLGVAVETTAFFDTLTIKTGARTADIVAAALAAGMNVRQYPSGDKIGISLDETTTPAIVEAIWALFGAAPKYADVVATEALPANLKRTSKFLTHPVFNQYHSETEMLRYMRRLADRDLALDRAMIPLGSCTMKLNATTEMIPVTWPEFGNLHPFAPADQAAGYAELAAALEKQLCAITGYDAFSFQPNSGAQGEYAGLLAINAYHESRGEGHRKICLIPASAHGTNPASAQMASMEVVGVKCDERGNVDVEDLREKAKHYADILAAVMITYPSTHGVFEERVREICEIVHECGGQVYLDGANLNAQVGVVYPGKFGADVSHLNLHKTFCIPHGGGGPGVGPIGVRAHLAPYLPGHPQTSPNSPVGPVSAAPIGSASILVISWAYILLMGGEGLTLATQTAILSANYIAKRLEGHYPTLYKNEHGRVAHECILDTRPLKASFGVSVDDLAKRLIDYGFHAPTMSFPVAGTLMVEPTESESKAEIDRFCDAMIAMRDEIRQIESGRWTADESPLHFAPHTIPDLVDEVWDRVYTRAEGCYPANTRRMDKYWAPVNRIDNAYGDRNLFCSCPPTAEYCEVISE